MSYHKQVMTRHGPTVHAITNSQNRAVHEMKARVAKLQNELKNVEATNRGLRRQLDELDAQSSEYEGKVHLLSLEKSKTSALKAQNESLLEKRKQELEVNDAELERKRKSIVNKQDAQNASIAQAFGLDWVEINSIAVSSDSDSDIDLSALDVAINEKGMNTDGVDGELDNADADISDEPGPMSQVDFLDLVHRIRTNQAASIVEAEKYIAEMIPQLQDPAVTKPDEPWECVQCKAEGNQYPEYLGVFVDAENTLRQLNDMRDKVIQPILKQCPAEEEDASFSDQVPEQEHNPDTELTEVLANPVKAADSPEPNLTVDIPPHDTTKIIATPVRDDTMHVPGDNANESVEIPKESEESGLLPRHSPDKMLKLRLPNRDSLEHNDTEAGCSQIASPSEAACSASPSSDMGKSTPSPELLSEEEEYPMSAVY